MEILNFNEISNFPEGIIKNVNIDSENLVPIYDKKYLPVEVYLNQFTKLYRSNLILSIEISGETLYYYNAKRIMSFYASTTRVLKNIPEYFSSIGYSKHYKNIYKEEEIDINVSTGTVYDNIKGEYLLLLTKKTSYSEEEKIHFIPEFIDEAHMLKDLKLYINKNFAIKNCFTNVYKTFYKEIILPAIEANIEVVFSSTEVIEQTFFKPLSIQDLNPIHSVEDFQSYGEEINDYLVFDFKM